MNFIQSVEIAQELEKEATQKKWTSEFKIFQPAAKWKTPAKDKKVLQSENVKFKILEKEATKYFKNITSLLEQKYCRVLNGPGLICLVRV